LFGHDNTAKDNHCVKGGAPLAKVKLLHERTFGGKPLKSLKLYDDPFGDNELCEELAFVDGQIEFVSIRSGKA
jgi:hypothetical protein